MKVEYPKALYRGTLDKFDSLIVKDASEEETARTKGWGEHPAHRRPAQPVIDSDNPRAKFNFRPLKG